MKPESRLCIGLADMRTSRERDIHTGANGSFDPIGLTFQRLTEPAGDRGGTAGRCHTSQHPPQAYRGCWTRSLRLPGSVTMGTEHDQILRTLVWACDVASARWKFASRAFDDIMCEIPSG